MKTILSLIFLFLSFRGFCTPPIKLCYENATVYPWITGDNQGLVISELKLIEKISRVKFQLIRLPWKRCQMEAEIGKIDGIIAASYNQERAKWGIYPYSNKMDELEQEYRLHTDSFYLYTQKNSNLKFENGKIHNLDSRPIGVQLGYSIGNNLEEWGYKIQSSFSETKDLIKELELDVLKAIVLQDHESKRQMNLNPELKYKIKRIEPALKTSDQFLLFNKNFFYANEKKCKDIWKATQKARNSNEYKNISKTL